MIQEFDDIKKQLAELTAILNGFKSEAVQLRILDYILGKKDSESDDRPAPTQHKPKKIKRIAITPKNGVDVKPSNRKKAASGTGAPATLMQLLETDFFNKPRTINHIIEHCKHNMARTFKANDLSGTLARIIRNGKLIRNKNTDKQYEYKKA